MDSSQLSNYIKQQEPPAIPPTPSFTSTGQQKLDPRAVWLFFLRSIFIFLPALIWISLIFIIFRFLSETLLVRLVLGIIIITFILAKLKYHFYRYELTEDSFRQESGITFKRYITIPYDKIQNIDIYRSTLDRILGLSDLHIQTAGTHTSIKRSSLSDARTEGRLPALSRKIAKNVRDELIRRARQTKNQGF